MRQVAPGSACRLNRRVPLQVDADLGLPVLVMLPGDDWVRGYAGRWQPHRLMDRGVVVVTVQSRLGALGAYRFKSVKTSVQAIRHVEPIPLHGHSAPPLRQAS